LGTFLSVLGLALCLVAGPGDLLHHVRALLPGHGDTLSASSVGTLLLVNVLGHGGGSVLTDFLSPVTANLARGVDVIANLSGDWAALLVGDNRTLLLVDLLGADAWNQTANTEGSWTAILDRNFLAGLSVGHLAVNLGNLATLEFRNVSTFLSGEGATLSGGRFRTLGSWNILAFFPLDSLTLPLLDIGTFLLWNIATFFLGDVFTFFLGDVTTFLGWNIPTLLGVVDLLADLLVDGVTLFGVDSVAFLAIDSVALPLVDGVALALGHVLALLLWNGVALPLIDHRALLLRNFLADLVLDSVALPLIDDLALGHGVGGALLLCHGLTFGLEPSGAGLGCLSGARFLVEGFLDSSWYIDTLQFLGIEALLLLHSGTLLTDVIDRGTLVLDLDRTFSPLNLFLNRLLGDLTFSFLGVGTSFTLDVSALLPGH